MKSIQTTPLDISRHLQSRRLEQEVENRTAYTIDTAELNIYETQHIAEKVELTFSSPVLASMIRGKKVMHLPGTPSFDFLPGESVIVPGQETMRIDFPEAQTLNPTQCLALAIDPGKVKQVTDLLNDRAPLIDNSNGWQFGQANFFLTNDGPIHQLIARLIYIFTENNKAKEVFANLVLQELVVRLMQTQARTLLLSTETNVANVNRLAHIAQYINKNLGRNLPIKELADEACMSEPNFYRTFRQTFGMTPVDFINQQRIALASKLLRTTNRYLADISIDCGFNNLTYFMKLFRREMGLSPAQYRKQVL
ncbi:AraC family transcriptional regulator [Spirosoma endbachense]|uniref:Helix-turn-helix domain-containing protein n=1 Tax=Spirosoma endbachense TaxID=2666025 RepID=A0A6P1W123_9BACT|nr:AraC family transcriptional regulator [Spirosoma endbachense]QHV99131.1 helix-turn-helix domain-containing protein [Spirosoma endbachense]